MKYGALIEPTTPDGVAVYTVDEFLVRNRISRGLGGDCLDGTPLIDLKPERGAADE